VVVIAREKGKIRVTGRSYELHWVQQYEFRDGKITRFLELTAPGDTGVG
jgi:ketosteroid isomerase-like protein